jgi:suppressor of G2 allele of SKP1
MAQEIENKAKEAFFDDDFSLAVDLYSQAIDLDPNNPNLFADRAQAYIKLNSFTEAVSDANKAILLNPTLSKAYLRKGYLIFNNYLSIFSVFSGIESIIYVYEN